MKSQIEKSIDKSFLKRFIAGIILGIGGIVPGISGGVLAVSMGLYDKMLKSVSNFLKSPKQNVKFLLPIGLGMSISIYILSGIVSWAFRNHMNQITFLFMGLVVGGIPVIIEKANYKGVKYKYILPFLLGISTIVIFENINIFGIDIKSIKDTIYGYSISGAVIAFGTVIPGISASFILMYIGTYEKIMSSIYTLDIHTLIVVGISFVIVAILTVKIADYIFEKFKSEAYYWVLGLLIGSIILMFPKIVININLLSNILLFIIGFLIQNKLITTNKNP